MDSMIISDTVRKYLLYKEVVCVCVMMNPNMGEAVSGCAVRESSLLTAAGRVNQIQMAGGGECTVEIY